MSMDKDLLIQEVAKQHHVLLSPDDPIFITVTLNELILKDYLAQVEMKLSESEQTIYEMQAKTIQDSKTVAEQIVTNGAKYLHENFEKAANELINKVSEVKIIANEKSDNHTEQFNELKTTNKYLLYLLLASVVINIIICIQLTLK
ncbi:hypothetical protein UL135_002678 [Acinetobacter baumannii]|uniref:hypothetical protein n=1 Tax=Acinetobacter TaxID=469 RepID=UPI0013D23704|nr:MULTISPECIES: hypothetical protein [Acinetobacter]ELZ3581712.1 hypothetical protein [Acinetobacter baumannii]ELZ3585850.1 hypothetical protein [Acinetobacter baumannii]MBD0448612.1 hypothetical protein [Acinetobacter baumannii]MDD2944971.1 hypothetical protein [Acinetobacter sp.]